jgi:hypothetical protein
MKNTLTLIVLSLLAAGPALSAEEQTYTLQDLQALAQSEQWGDLRRHLKDVPPSRRDAGWNGLVEKACLRDDVQNEDVQVCMDLFRNVIALDKSNTDLAFRAGKWSRLRLQSWAALPFFDRAIVKADESRCQDHDLSLAVMSGLALPSDNAHVKIAKSLAFDRCWAAMKPVLQKEFASEGIPGYLPDNVCGALKAKGGMSKEQTEKCKK